MKTPMQELIEIIKKRKEDDDAMPFMYNDRIIELAESLLEKEKEQIMDAYMEGGDWESLPQPRFDNYYNQTFNTKER
jgi:hypothetical protein